MCGNICFVTGAIDGRAAEIKVMFDETSKKSPIVDLKCEFTGAFVLFTSNLLWSRLSLWEMWIGFTYVSVAVQCVVCQLDFVEANRLCLPMWAQCRTIRMNVHALCTLWLSTTSWRPLAVRKFIPAITERCHFEYNTVVSIFLQSG